MITLGALLLNPPSAGGSRTIQRLKVAAELLNCGRLEIANLYSIATSDAGAINAVGQSIVGWEAARPRIEEVIAESDHLLAGWGVSGISGKAARHKEGQIEFVGLCANRMGHQSLWTLNGEARHPSRWHQYVSDKYGRATGTHFHERLGTVLTLVPVDVICFGIRSAQLR